MKNGVIGIRMKLHIFRLAAQGSGYSGLDGYGHLQPLLSRTFDFQASRRALGRCTKEEGCAIKVIGGACTTFATAECVVPIGPANPWRILRLSHNHLPDWSARDNASAE